MKNLIEFENRIQTLSDAELMDQMNNLFHREKRLGDAILLGLREIKIRRLYAAMGYSSLFEMLNKFFKLSESSCYQRLQALKLIESVEGAQDSLFKGEISLSNLATTQNFINNIEKTTQTALTREEKQELVDIVKEKSSKEALAALMNSPLAQKNPKASLPPNKEKPLAAEHTQLQLTLDKETMAQLQEIRDLLGHSVPSGDYSQILKHITGKMLHILRKEKGRVFLEKKKSSPSQVHEGKVSIVKNRKTLNLTTKCDTDMSASPQRTAVPMETKRKIFARAGGQCEYKGIGGHRCTSRFQLELDHSIPVSHGGGNDLENLKITCRNHNQYRVKETHGYLYQAKR